MPEPVQPEPVTQSAGQHIARVDFFRRMPTGGSTAYVKPDVAAEIRQAMEDVLGLFYVKAAVCEALTKFFVARDEKLRVENEQLKARAEKVLALHQEFKIYDECGHDHRYLENGGLPEGVHEIDEVGLTCQDGYMYSICSNCCTGGSQEWQTEVCADQHKHDGKSQCWPCPTRVALTATEEPAAASETAPTSEDRDGQPQVQHRVGYDTDGELGDCLDDCPACIAQETQPAAQAPDRLGPSGVGCFPPIPVTQDQTTTEDDPHFGLVTIRRKDGWKRWPCEYTPSPHLVIAACATDDEGRPAFGGWCIVVRSHELTLPVPTPHCDDIETVRWFAHRLAEADIDWTLPKDELIAVAQPVFGDLLRQADKADAESTAPGVIPASTLRQMCEANERVIARKEQDDV